MLEALLALRDLESFLHDWCMACMFCNTDDNMWQHQLYIASEGSYERCNHINHYSASCNEYTICVADYGTVGRKEELVLGANSHSG